MTGAAFFDLDRTLLAGASGTAFSAAMRTAGYTSRELPGERAIYGLFNRIGETRPSMALARQGARMSKGRPRAAMIAAGEAAADDLAAKVQPFAGRLFAEHRAAGHPIVLATTTPYDLVAPLADKLGLDDVVATRYGVSDDGTYDGSLDGPFVWAAGKLAAVKTWAEAHDVALEESYAYSDSYYDAPLLSAVGTPIVVNPDPRMVVLATLRRWPILNLDVSPGVVKIPVLGIELQSLAMQFSRPELIPYARFDISGVEHIPSAGPAILVANHRSYFDSAAMSIAIGRSGRTVRFLGKKEVFDAPVVGALATAMGGIRVDRGTGSDEPLQAAADALTGGEVVAVMPQGTIPRGPAFFEPELQGRWGAARLAEMTRAPVIPIGLWGTERVWPRSSRLPNMLNVADPPQVTVRVGAPVPLKYRSLDADTKRIMAAISDLLPAEARTRRDPTRAELARTYPPGYKGDPTAEADAATRQRLMADLTPHPIAVAEGDLDDLRARLARTRWPEREAVDDWSQGIPLGYVQELCRYWAQEYDWRRVEAELNHFEQLRFTPDVGAPDRLGIQVLHAPSPHPGALPLVLTHGWPGSVVEFLDVVEPLRDPVAHGGDATDAFHVVCPTMPGYGFSDKPAATGWGVERIAAAWVELMAALGYDAFGAQGGDWGSAVTTALGASHGDHCIGIHLNMVTAGPGKEPGELTEAEQAALARLEEHRRWGMGYSTQQSTRPQTVGYGLVDSPAAQAAWIVEKFWAWADHDGHPEDAVPRDRLLDNVMHYWLPAAGASSARLYWESFHTFGERAAIDVPAGMSIFPKEIFAPSRRWAERRFTDIRTWTEHDRGGHFAAFEEPAPFVEDVRAFFRHVR